MLLNKKLIKEHYLEIIKKEWYKASDQFPDFLTEIPENTKRQNELYAKKVSEDFEILIHGFPRFPLARKKWKKEMFFAINNVLYHETVIGIHSSMNKEEIDEFQEELMDFLRHERSFSPELSIEEIGQALRNYIVYAMFKRIHQIKSGFSMAGFGYSMLYPFTDNYIDNSSYTNAEKATYNQIIRDKIEGKEIHPQTVHQKKTCDLLQRIESEYPRKTDTTIYDLLLMILEAQEESIRQQNKGIPLTAEERLDISLYKGGISVLIDRFFVSKELNEEEILLYLSLGFFLQLADDLQDIKTDHDQGGQTLLTLDLNPVVEEHYTNKLLHFIHTIMGSYQAENNLFKNFVLENCYQLIYISIVGSKEFFSEEYLKQIETHLPISYSFYEEMQKGMLFYQDGKAQKRYLTVLDEMISNK